MKKRKTYEISVIDKTYSKTISDETKFYTSDTALELGFELKETEYDFESAEIVLLNIDDRSLVTRPVAKSSDSFTYELDDDIIPHYGEWRGQLRFEAGETYVSSPVKFRIENDLSNDRPPQLSDVQSWVSLKRYADGLVDELKQAVEEAVANVEAMDDTFKANELDRDKAERERQVRFEDAESEREKGESVRVETFQTNEANRQSQFETAEQSRQTTFETAEQERQSAELIRIENENQRNLTIVVNEYEPMLKSGYVGGSVGKEKIRIYKDGFGFVHIHGRVEGSTLFGPSNPVFNVPVELRPAHVQAGAICLNSIPNSVGTGIRIMTNSGDCYFTSAPSTWTLINFSYFAGL